MKFINYLQSIAGVSIFPMISLFIFFIFFILLTVVVVKMSKSEITTLENIPLETTESNTTL